MKVTKTLIAGALAAMVGGTPAFADLVFPSLSYRTGPYAAGGIPFADGYADYLTLVNERDGGVGGVMTKLLECETGYNTEKGVECYESTKGEGALLYQPLSTGITYQLIPKATADGIPVHSMGYGRTSAANGKVFKWVFNYPGNYWDGASGIVNDIIERNGGDIKGKKIALLYHNSAYGKEPIRTLEELSKKHGFDLSLIPVDHPGQEQKSQWLQIRRDRPDYTMIWGWGIMNTVAMQEAANIRYNMENFYGIWWSGSEIDVLPAGEAANGYRAATFHGVGKEYPVFADIQKHVVDTGKVAGAGDNVGTVLYNRGLYAAMLAVEAARKAQEISGKKDINPGDMREGMEALVLDNARLKELGLEGFGPEINVSCASHGGPGLIGISQWDAKAKTWSIVSNFAPVDRAVLDPLIMEDSEAFAKENNITPRACN